MVRSTFSLRPNPSASHIVISKRLFSARPPLVTGFGRSAAINAGSLAKSIGVVAPGAVRLNPVQCPINCSRTACSPFNSESKLSDRPPTGMDPLYPGCDLKHWVVVMLDRPGGKCSTKLEMIDCYIQTLAKVIGSEEEAKKKIYNVSCEGYFGFGCEIDEETSFKLEGLPGILVVIPDVYMDVENKDYGAELLVNGEIVERPPERQNKADQESQLPGDGLRGNDRRWRYSYERLKLVEFKEQIVETGEYAWLVEGKGQV